MFVFAKRFIFFVFAIAAFCSFRAHASTITFVTSTSGGEGSVSNTELFFNASSTATNQYGLVWVNVYKDSDSNTDTIQCVADKQSSCGTDDWQLLAMKMMPNSSHEEKLYLYGKELGNSSSTHSAHIVLASSSPGHIGDISATIGVFANVVQENPNATTTCAFASVSGSLANCPNPSAAAEDNSLWLEGFRDQQTTSPIQNGASCSGGTDFDHNYLSTSYGMGFMGDDLNTGQTSNGQLCHSQLNGTTLTIHGVVLEPYTTAPGISSLAQFKLNASASITEGNTITTSTLAFRATVSSPVGNQVRLEVEYKDINQSFSNQANASSSLVSSGSTTTITVSGLSNGSYHWQARAVDSANSTSTWQEFGTAGNTDFIISAQGGPIQFAESWHRSVPATTTSEVAGTISTSTTAAYGLVWINTYDNQASDIVTSVTDGPSGPSYTRIASVPEVNTPKERWYLYAKSFGNTTTTETHSARVTLSASADLEVMVALFSGVDPDTDLAKFVTAANAASPIFYLDQGGLSASRTNSYYVGGIRSTIATPTAGTSSIMLAQYPSATMGVFSALNTPLASGGYPTLSSYINGAGWPQEGIALMLEPFPPVDNFYVQIKNTNTLNLRSASSTSATILKTLPADWVVYVASTTDSNGQPFVGNNYTWYKVVDLQGGTSTISGWMAASSTTATYLYYSTTTLQSTLEGMANTIYSASSTRAEKIVEAVNWYWNHVTSTDSLYNTGFPYLFSATSTASSTWVFPKELFFAMASRESGGVGFNNQNISKDYGHGIMQLTPTGVWANEPDDWASNAEEVPTYGSHIAIPPCTMVATTTYTRCYTNSGTQSPLPKEYKDYGYANASTTYKFYANTSQSIYANIKDGLTVLRNKYNVSSASSSVTASSTVFQPYEREWLRATWLYNGASSTSSYLSDVADEMDTFADYRSSTGTQMVATSSFTIDLANKLRIANDYKEEVVIFSPVELSITDSAGRIAGLVNGKIKEEIPDSAYNPQRKAVTVFFSTSTYTYYIKGVGNGTYGFLIDHPDDGSKLNIYAPAVPVKVGEAHTYRVDWNAIRQGQDGVTIKIDNNGDGVIEKEVVTGASLAGVTLYTAPVPVGTIQSSFYPAEDTQILCNDSIDNDNDGVMDISDQDCKAFIPPPPPVRYVPVVTIRRTPDITTSTPAITSSTINNSPSTINNSSSTEQ